MSPASIRNLPLILVALAAGVWSWFVLPIWVLPTQPAWAFSLVPIALLSNSLWSLIHEGVHGHLLESRRWNRWLSRMLAIVHGSTFGFLQLAHLTHHRYNRDDDEQIEYWTEGQISKRTAIFNYYHRILGGTYKEEYLAPFVVWFPRYRAVGADPSRGNDHVLSKQNLVGILFERRRLFLETRVDSIILLLTWSLAFYSYGYSGWMLFAVLQWRGIAISFLTYVYHYGAPLGDRKQGFNLSLPGPLRPLLLHFNYHGVHHRHPHLRWWELPRRFRDESFSFDDTYARAALRQLRGPIRRELAAQGPEMPPRANVPAI